jgi:hypothetical protein
LAGRCTEGVRALAEMLAILEENIGMLPAIKSFPREGHESDLFQRGNAKLMRIAKRQWLIESILSPSIHLLAGLGLLLPGPGLPPGQQTRQSDQVVSLPSPVTTALPGLVSRSLSRPTHPFHWLNPPPLGPGVTRRHRCHAGLVATSRPFSRKRCAKPLRVATSCDQ